MVPRSDWLSSWQVRVDETAPPVLVASISRDGHVAGHARVTITGSVAELEEIVIYEPEGRAWESVSRFLRLRVRKTNRGQGLGTRLLDEVLSHLRGLGVASVQGVIRGDRARLVRWFRSAGFNVNEETGRIRTLVR